MTTPQGGRFTLQACPSSNASSVGWGLMSQAADQHYRHPSRCCHHLCPYWDRLQPPCPFRCRHQYYHPLPGCPLFKDKITNTLTYTGLKHLIKFIFCCILLFVLTDALTSCVKFHLSSITYNHMKHLRFPLAADGLRLGFLTLHV